MSTPLRGVDLNTVVQMVVQVGQPQTGSLALLSTQWSNSGQSGGHVCSKGYAVPLDKFRFLGITKLIWPKIMKQMEAFWCRSWLWKWLSFGNLREVDGEDFVSVYFTRLICCT